MIEPKPKPKYKKLDNIEIILIIISLLLILFSFLAPILFTQNYSGIDFTSNGAIGDTIGGIMNPFIALSGVLLTFLAFYIQFKANKQQRELFRQELNSDKFENQFYEMLKLHKENVNDITITLKSFSNIEHHKSIENELIKGRETFNYLIEEIKIIYYIAKKRFKDKSKDDLLNIAYSIFFQGIEKFKDNSSSKKEITEFQLFVTDLDLIYRINNNLRKSDYEFENSVKKKSDMSSVMKLNYKIFQGYSFHLAHYYRHLYQTVKFITKQTEDFITYNEKRNYLRILRSQLSNQEQAMLFYNWKSKFGSNWENNVNRFFTDYRMIHNLYDDLLIEDFKLNEIFDINSSELMKEKGRKSDSLFEYQDW